MTTRKRRPRSTSPEIPGGRLWAGVLSLIACLVFFALASGGKVIIGPAFDGDLLVTPAYVFLLVFVNVAAGPTVLRIIARVLVTIALPVASIARNSLGNLAQEMKEDDADDDDMMQALPRADRPSPHRSEGQATSQESK